MGRADEGEVGDRLGEVADHASAARVVLLGDQPHVEVLGGFAKGTGREVLDRGCLVVQVRRDDDEVRHRRRGRVGRGAS